jgi:hypothetical protein
VDIAENFPGLSETDLSVFGLFCERALSIGNLLASINIQDVASAQTLAELGAELAHSLDRLIDDSYLQRSGWHQYTVTPAGFESYARSYIEGYDDREGIVKDAVAALDQTNTEAVMASTGETRQVVNHVLRLLHRDRNIGGFVTASGSYCVTRVSPEFRIELAARKPAG